MATRLPTTRVRLGDTRRRSSTLRLGVTVIQRGAPLLAKRLLDGVAAACLLILCAPLLAAVAVVIAVTLGFPVLFRQRRPGRGGAPITVLKFRSMRDARGPDGTLLPDSARITPFGRSLRSTSLDELPQLWNVLRGDLSLVGPRPLLMSYLSRYSPEEARRHEVLPGITGWAQVNGRNAISWEQKFALDVWYVDHWTPWLDLKILAMTLGKVVKREGISRAGQATTTEFLGAADPERAHGDQDARR